MGYYTRYELSICDKSGNDTSEEINEDVISGLGLEYVLGGDDCKWYNHEEDMIKVSLLLKDKLLKLHGVGEESGDIWDKYFLNGKMQVKRAEVKIPPYDSTWSE